MSKDKKVIVEVAVLTAILWGVSGILYFTDNQLLASMVSAFAVLGTGILGAIGSCFLNEFLLRKEKKGGSK